MARNPSNAVRNSDLGQLVGQALADGLLEGLQSAFANVRAELAPLQAEVIALLEREVAETAAQLQQETAAGFVEGVRTCTEGGCSRRAVARSLCRRHYARQMYQERREKAGEPVKSRRQPREAAGGEDVPTKKMVAPVAPIVRRKKNEEAPAEPVESAPRLTVVPPPQPAQAGVSVESVARFFGLNK